MYGKIPSAGDCHSMLSLYINIVLGVKNHRVQLLRKSKGAR